MCLYAKAYSFRGVSGYDVIFVLIAQSGKLSNPQPINTPCHCDPDSYRGRQSVNLTKMLLQLRTIP